MRQEQPAKYAAGTKVDSHRSRAELARLLARYGASDFVVLEHDANATIGFALHGKYVQYLLPLPDPDSPFFTHTPTGRPRVFEAQERAYEQAVRQQWRRALLVMRGKLEAVESGLSTFEREFYGAIAEEKRERPAALLLRRRMRWAPETMLLILCLGVFVPASGGLALGLPVTAVDKVTSPFWGDQPDQFGAAKKSSGAESVPSLRLGSGGNVVVSRESGSGPSGTVVAHPGSTNASNSSSAKHAASPKHGTGGSSGSSHPGKGSGKGPAGGNGGKPNGGGNGNGGGSSSGNAGGSSNGNGNGTGGNSGGNSAPSSGGGGSSGGSGGSSAAPPPPPPPPPPAAPSGGKGLGSQDKGNGWDNGNKGGAGGASSGNKK
jgi:hypothetical protein